MRIFPGSRERPLLAASAIVFLWAVSFGLGTYIAYTAVRDYAHSQDGRVQQPGFTRLG